MKINNILPWVGLSATAVNGYILHFYNSATGRCAGQHFPAVTAEVGHCGNFYTGLAQQVTLEREKGEGDYIVEFFSDKFCKDHIPYAEGSAGCLAIGTGGETAEGHPIQYGSFKIIKSPEGWKRSEERAQKQERTEMVQRTADANPLPYHGEVFEQGNQTWRWHQIYKDAWSGVAIDSWDDKLHVANHEELGEILEEIEIVASAAVTPAPVSALEQRDIKGLCRTSVLCAANLAHRTAQKAWSLRERAPEIADKIATAASKKGKSIWDFLNTPFGVALSGVGGTGAVVYSNTYINNRWAPGKPKVEDCSTVGKQKDVIQSSIEDVTKLTDLESAEIDITFSNGAVSQVHVSLAKRKGDGKCNKAEPKDL